jgi:hypothetical protein
MAGKAKEKPEAGKKETMEVRFKCRMCGQEKPLSEMRSITRFVPVLIVCEDCARIQR